PATWYRYHLSIVTKNGALLEELEIAIKQGSSLPLQCFRTLAAPKTMPQKYYLAPPLRIAYGSCRKTGRPEADALNMFGTWLLDHLEERETLWPDVLLLIGDQIYADEPP